MVKRSSHFTDIGGLFLALRHSLTVAIGAAFVFSAFDVSAAELTATRLSGGSVLYSTAAQWDGGVVPLNNLSDQFNVIIPTGLSVTFDVDPASQINDFTLAPNANFTVGDGKSLTVLDDTSIGGTVTATTTNSLFQATGDGAAFHPSGAKLFVTLGGTIRIAATSFTNTSSGTFTQFSADGAGSLLDLSSLLSYTETLGGGASGTRTVAATNNGVIDLSNLGTVTKTDTGGTVRFNVASGGNINLANLTTVSGFTIIDIDNPSYALPSLTTATRMTVDLANGSTFTANALTDFVSGTVTYSGDNPGTFQANSLSHFKSSTVSLTTGQNFNVIGTGLVDIDSSRISVRGGRQLGATEIAATSFTNTSSGTFTQFSADGAGSLLDLSSLLSYTETLGGGASGTRTVAATNNGVIDLSNLGTITKTDTGGTVRFQANSGGKILFGNVNTSGSVQFTADGTNSKFEFSGSVDLKSPGTLTLTNAATMTVSGDFRFNYTNEAAWNLNAGIVTVEGSSRHFFEAGGQDLGVNGATSGNFGIGQLKVGSTGTTTATLVDFVDNGNRGSSREALYLYGFGGSDGLRILNGSTLAIGNLNTYAFINGQMVHLNAMFGPGVSVLAFDQGFLAATITLPGDYNGNGVVDAGDYVVWRKRLGATGLQPYQSGDGDGDGKVTNDDYLIWRGQFGKSAGSALSAVTEQVPEPACGLLLVTALAFMTCSMYPPRRQSSGSVRRRFFLALESRGAGL